MSNSSEIDLLPKQDDAWSAVFDDPDITEVGYGGAAGGGKTRLGWYVMVFGYCESYAGARVAVGRKELKTLRITTLAELFKIFQELGYKEKRDYTFNGQDNIMKFPNGSEIILLDMAYSPQDPEYTRFGSLNLSAAWVEESNESPEKGIQILKTRVGRNNMLRPVITDEKTGKSALGDEVEVKGVWLETFNPNKGHVHRTYYRPYKDKKMPHYRCFIPALPGDNPHLSKAYIEGLKRADRTTRERLLQGNFDYDNDPQKIFVYESIQDLRHNTLPKPDVKTNEQKFLINDIARKGGDRIVLGEFEGMTLVGLTVNSLKELDETEQDIKDQARESRIPFSQVLSDTGGIGGGVPDHVKGTKGFNGSARPRAIWDDFSSKEIPQNYSNLRSQCYFKLAELVNLHLMAINLRYFKTNIEGYTEDMALAELEEELDAVKKVPPSGSQNEKEAIMPKRGEKSITEALGRSPDIADVMMMRMYYEFAPVAPEKERKLGKTVVVGGSQQRVHRQSGRVAINRAY